jgi:hypothetical protein
MGGGGKETGRRSQLNNALLPTRELVAAQSMRYKDRDGHRLQHVASHAPENHLA